ncbi:hypothetical protein WICPIJ_005327 [Wickerhamomyces pijperi]|uniref:Uncharacterized protein n=1 Tax=Wickerhamomyces pijperi TaxID=599730 RepID=A0A9P8Q456_WICPI|nr:hypothetical protein WICPIJ_005327 [Wickerhamomyces pijperi]
MRSISLVLSPKSIARYDNTFKASLTVRIAALAAGDLSTNWMVNCGTHKPVASVQVKTGKLEMTACPINIKIIAHITTTNVLFSGILKILDQMLGFFD